MSFRSNATNRSSIFDNRTRTCTDWPCLIIFILLLSFYIVFAIFVFHEGSLHRFIYPSDSQGRICGSDSQIDRKYLQFFDIIRCIKYVLIGTRCPTQQICVEQCPTSFYHYKMLYAQELKLDLNKENKFQRIRNKLLCEKSARSQVQNSQISIYSLVKERKVCAPYAFPSMPLYGRCIPSIIVRALNFTIEQADDIIKNHGGNLTDDDIIPNKESMQNSLEYIKKVLKLKRIISYIIEDLRHSRFILLISFLCSILILIVYMILLRYIAQWIILLSLVFCVAIFALATVFSFQAHFRIRQYSFTDKNRTLSDIDEMNITFNLNETDNDYINIISNTALANKTQSTLENFHTTMILLNEFAPMSIIWLTIGIACCIICTILMICICCLWKRILLAATLIEEASRAISHTLIILLWPIIVVILNVAIVIFGILVLAYYSTLGQPIYQISCSKDLGQSCQQEFSPTNSLSNESTKLNIYSKSQLCFNYKEGDNCNPDDFSQLNCSIDHIRCVYVSYGFVDRTFQNYLNTLWSYRLSHFLSKYSWIGNIYNIFIIYWLLAFILALEEMVLACTFVSYYWELNELNKKCCGGGYFDTCLCFKGLSMSCRYHLGTIAFGSSIIAIIDTIRTLIDLIKDRIESLNTVNYGQCCLKLMNYSLKCIRHCFQYFSRYTYIMTAVSGKWFCPSAFIATRLLLENCLRLFVLDRVCEMLLFIGRLTITIGSCVFTGYMLDRNEQNINLHFAWCPILIIGIIVYMSSAIFLNVYSTATSTLFFCVLYDLDTHDGTQIRPYMMSNRLQKVLNKSNDFREKYTFRINNEQSTTDKTQSKF